MHSLDIGFPWQRKPKAMPPPKILLVNRSLASQRGLELLAGAVNPIFGGETWPRLTISSFLLFRPLATRPRKRKEEIAAVNRLAARSFFGAKGWNPRLGR